MKQEEQLEETSKSSRQIKLKASHFVRLFFGEKMRIVIQRSGKSNVLVDGSEVGVIKSGLVLLVCIEKSDDSETIKKAANKILSLRIFEDQNGKMNKSITEVNGEILAISQFTLSWKGLKGNRPSFDNSMNPEKAIDLFNEFTEELRNSVFVSTGSFGASMDVKIQNLGPVTFCLDF